MAAVRSTETRATSVGEWRIIAKRPGYEPVDVTFVRGAPTTIERTSFEDPFGPASATLRFPSVTSYDAIGSGDLYWLAPEVDFDIEWVGDLPDGFPYDRWVWEGFSLPVKYDDTEVVLDLVGAMHEVDGELAKPAYLSQPLPYEVAIARCFRNRPWRRLKPLSIEWPTWWTRRYTADENAAAALVPLEVVEGDLWSDMLTRSTGSWDPMLTSYLQTLLSSMYTERGRFTLDLDPGRKPVLRHRNRRHGNDPDTEYTEVYGYEAYGWKRLTMAGTVSTDYSSPAYDDSGWAEIQMPQGNGYVPAGYPAANTTVGDEVRSWLRRTVPAAAGYRVSGFVEDNCTIYWNGTAILTGSPSGSSAQGAFSVTVPAAAIVEGDQVVAIRHDDEYDGMVGEGGDNVYFAVKIEALSYADVIVVEALQPGVKPDLIEDWSQRANVFYGQSRALSGEAYSGLVARGANEGFVYEPVAALRQVHPATDANGWFDPSKMRRESLLELPPGLSRSEVERVGINHLAAFAEPGFTGTVTLSADVRMASGSVLNRNLIRPGMSLQLRGFKGRREGVFLHISAVESTPGGDVTLTVDSKYRDHHTVEEVRARTRDALQVPRALQAARFRPPLPDQLFPWNYAEGSGFIPSGYALDASRLFEGMPHNILFPWTEWTTQRPPRRPAWRHCYIKIGPKSANADNNWAFRADRNGGRFGFPIRMAQAGQIQLVQFAAYDADGNVMPVPFHLSIYYQRNVNVQSMPKIPADQAGVDGYAAGQHYPFFDGAFETYYADGRQVGIEVTQTVQSAGLIRGWGNGSVQAGHWPGASDLGDPPTGMLVDEDTWSWDFVGVGGFSQINPFATPDEQSIYAAHLYCMIYCDAQEDQDVYFLGRMYRSEPGQQV